MRRDSICCFDQDMAFRNVNTLEKEAKYEQEEWEDSFQPSWQSKGPCVFLSVFFFYLDFPWPLTTATMAVMFWETVHLHAVLFCCHFFLLNRPVKYCQGKYVSPGILAQLTTWRKKNNMDPWGWSKFWTIIYRNKFLLKFLKKKLSLFTCYSFKQKLFYNDVAVKWLHVHVCLQLMFWEIY